jgi:cyanophycin synthetase
VPPKGQRVILRNNANLSTGGTATDVTDDVHPEVAARAIAAAQMVGLHICGVDVVCESVLRPLEEQTAASSKSTPRRPAHAPEPSFGKGRRVGEAMVGHVQRGEDGRIPVVAVTGTNGKTTTARLIAHLFAASGLRVGMTNTDGVYVDGRQIDSGDCSGPSAQRAAAPRRGCRRVRDRPRRHPARRPGFDRCQVAVVTNIGAGDHLGLNYITTVEDLAVVKRVIVQNVAPTAMPCSTPPTRWSRPWPRLPGQGDLLRRDRHHP